MLAVNIFTRLVIPFMACLTLHCFFFTTLRKMTLAEYLYCFHVELLINVKESWGMGSLHFYFKQSKKCWRNLVWSYLLLAGSLL